MIRLFVRACALIVLVSASALHAQVPGVINYQGRVAVNGVNFDDVERFKFAIVNAADTATYRSNVLSTGDAEPAGWAEESYAAQSESVTLPLPHRYCMRAGRISDQGQRVSSQ